MISFSRDSRRLHYFTVTAFLIALYVILSYIALDLRVMKISFAGLAIVIAGLELGPASGLEVGLLGAFLEQLLRYGISPTIMFWILPVAVRGLMTGLYARHFHYRLNVQQTAVIVITGALVLTGLNTIAILVDSIIYGYYSFGTVFGALLIRIVTALATSLVYLILLPLILPRISGALKPLQQA